MKRFLGLAFVVTVAFAAAAMAATQTEHVRGAIQSFDNDSITIHSRSGANVKVMLNGGSKYLYVVKSSLSKVDEGTFIGTATKKEGDKLVALEVVVFPESMRGTGEGHYPWDKLPDTAQSGGGMVSSSMTNGSVSGPMSGGSASGTMAPKGPGLVQSSMTNGNIESARSQSGGKQITVTYEGGQKKIIVPPTAPIVTLRKADKSALKQDAHVFLIAARKNGELVAKVVAVGKNGVNPPM